MRIVIVTLGSRGDVQPYVALAKEAILKSHSVVICTGKSFKDFIEKNKVEFSEISSDLMAMLESKEGKEIFNNPLKNIIKTKSYLKNVVNPAYRNTLSEVYKIAKNADIIIYHPKAFGIPDISKALNIDCISIPPVPIIYPIEEFPNLVISPTKNFGKHINKLTYELLFKGESASIKEINDFRKKELNLSKRKSGIYTLKIDDKEIPMIYPVSKILFKDVKSWSDKVYLSGFFYLENEEDILDEKIVKFINDGKKPIIISFSSAPLKDSNKFTEKLILALKKSNNRAIILTGNSGMEINNEKDILTVKECSHKLLFKLAKGILHHGGVGTMAEALRSGNPQSIIPFSREQLFWANRLYNLGYSMKPLKEKDVTVEELVMRFDNLENFKIRENSVLAKEQICKENGTKNAIKYIENYYEKQKRITKQH